MCVLTLDLGSGGIEDMGWIPKTGGSLLPLTKTVGFKVWFLDRSVSYGFLVSHADSNPTPDLLNQKLGCVAPHTEQAFRWL